MRIFASMALLAGAASAADLAAGWTHSVAVKDGYVWTWGDNAYGQLGQPDAGRARRPRRIGGLSNVVAVAASWHTLALTADGQVYAWGRNTDGQLGNGRFGLEEKEPIPARVAGLADIVAVSAGWDHSLALTRSGQVYAWGSRSHGQLGDGSRKTGQPAAEPMLVPGLADIKAIAAGGQHSLALRKDGTPFAWGSNWNGQLGNGKLRAGTHSAVPQPVLGPDGKGVLANVTGIAAGGLHSVAVTGEGQLYAWGYNGTGQIPCGSRGGFWDDKGLRDVPLPTAALVVEGKKAKPAQGKAVAAGYESTCALTSEGKVFTAGWSMYGELGSGSSGGNRDTFGSVLTGRPVIWERPKPGVWRPTLVYRYTDEAHVNEGIKDLEVADAFTGPALTVSAASASAGGARSGRIARNADNIETQATLIYPAQAEAGKPLSCLFARLMFGTHEGDNDFATQVRLRWTNAESGETVDIPLDTGARAGAGILPPLADIVTLATGMHHALARDRAGDLWAWGHNGYGQVGDGSVTDRTLAQKLAPFDETARPLPPPPRPTEAADATPPPGDKVANVRALGAVGDGITLDQPALQRAIDECGRQGGGIVWFPPGTYLTGTLELRDGVRLHLSAGATILAATNRDHYPKAALISAAHVSGIGVSGQGVIDGQGHFVGARDWRHYVVLFEDCRDVRVEGVSTINSGCWTEHYIRCIGLTIRNVTVRSLRPGRNNDGIDLSGCENVRIEGCTVISDDDAIVIKSQSAERVNRNIEAVNNVCHTYRGAFKLGTETRGAYENIVCRDLTCYGAKALELYSVDGSEVNGVDVENVRAYDALIALNIKLGARLRPSYWAKGLEPKVGCLRKVHIRNVTAEIGGRSWREVLLDHNITDAEWATGQPEAPYDSCISGLPGQLVEDVSIDGLQARVPGGADVVPDVARIPEKPDIYPHGGNFGVLPAYGLFVRHAKNVTIRNAAFEAARPDARPPFASFDAPGLSIE